MTSEMLKILELREAKVDEYNDPRRNRIPADAQFLMGFIQALDDVLVILGHW